MKSTLLKTVFALLATSIISTAAFAESTMEKVVKSGKLTIAVQTQGPPVSFVNKAGKRTGLAVELARLFAKDMGVELIIQDYDWKGLIPALKSGKADMIAADMTPTAKRHMQVVFSNPVFFAENIAFALKDKGYKSWADLNKSGVKVGATQASTYATAITAKMPEATLKEYSGGNPQTVQAVVSGRIEGGVSDRASIAAFINDNPKLMVLDGTLTKEPLGFAVRPDSMHLLMAINNYVRLIEHDGRLKETVDYWWNTTNWQADNN